MNEFDIQSVYLLKEGLLEPLLEELSDPLIQIKDDLIFSSRPHRFCCFAQDSWTSPQMISIQSIQDGIKKLKALYPFWHFHGISHFRRGNLIESGLKRIKNQEIDWQSPLPKHQSFSFTLLDPNTLLISGPTTRCYPDGIIQFMETKLPPSRAYLKLIEAFHLIQKWPKPKERCLEIGAAPGSWSYILSELKTNLTACDKAPLDLPDRLKSQIHFLKQDGFKLTPDLIGPCDWLFSDVICYPEKLFDFVKKWVDSKLCPNMICTIKFQGAIDLSILEKFKKIENSQLIHLYHNKHEITWIYLAKELPIQ